MARELRPDVVTLDVQMPHMGGLETLERLMEEAPVPVLLLSSLTSEGADVTLRGLELGALDFVDKSTAQGQMNLLSLAEELRAKVRALAGVAAPRSAAREPPPVRESTAPRAAPGPSWWRSERRPADPTALQAVIPRLPEDLRGRGPRGAAHSAWGSPAISPIVSPSAAPCPCARRATGRR